MKNRLFWTLIAGTMLMMSVSTSASDKSGDPVDTGFTKADKEFYLTESQIEFIRPGLEL